MIKYIIISLGILVLLFIFGKSSNENNIGKGVVISQYNLRHTLISVVQMKGGNRVSALSTSPLIIEGDKVEVFRRVNSFFGIVIDDYHVIHPLKIEGELISIGNVISSTKFENTFDIKITDGLDTFSVKSNTNFDVGQKVDLYLNENKNTIILTHDEWMDTILTPHI